jgi:hypothetical protein
LGVPRRFVKREGGTRTPRKTSVCKQHCPPDYSGSSEPAAQLEELNVCPASKVAPGSTRTALPTAPACKKDDEIR